jgi:hypothetical protein
MYATSKEGWLIAIDFGFIHAKIASREDLRRIDNLHNQGGDAFPGDFCSFERLIPSGRLVVHLVYVCQPRRAEDTVVQPEDSMTSAALRNGGR